MNSCLQDKTESRLIDNLPFLLGVSMALTGMILSF